MRKVIFTLAAAGSALAFAAPASAQYFPAAQPYGNAYGYNNYGQTRALQVRIDRIERQIDRLDRRDRVRDRSADVLRREANGIENRLRRSARGGLNPYEANDIQMRIARLEQRVQWAANQRGNGYGYGNGHNGWNADRDRDGRDDRGERHRDRDGDHRGDRDDR